MQPRTLYLDCRRELLAACEAAGPSWTSAVQHPLRGPAGERLYIDLAWFGPREARDVLVIASGTHGAEGPTGSTIQAAGVRAGLFAGLPEGLAVLLIHAQNPWGFAWMRRTTEDGVDLNRNFIDFRRPPPRNPSFDRRFAELLVPAHALAGPEAEATDLALLQLFAERGQGQLVAGQYEFEFAPFYGGEAPTWSNRRLRALWTELLAGRRRVVYIDLHTGLGERGEGLLMCADEPSMLARTRAIWGPAVHAEIAGDELHYRAHGGLVEALAAHLPGVEVSAVVHEFGTLPAIVVLSALRADHRVWQFGDPINANPELERALARMRDAFAPDDPRWRATVVDAALAVQRDAIAALRD